MGASRIEQLIEDIYEFVESCRMQPLSTTKVIVPKDELYDLLDELRLRTPDEIKRYQKIISNRDAIIADAEEKAAAIMAEAGEKAHSLINDHEIMQQAYDQANELVSKAASEAEKIIADANNDANQIRAGALSYTDEMLSDVENILTNAYESSRTKYENLLNALKGNLDIVINNKNELKNSGQEYTNEESAAEQTGEEYSDDDFNFDENTFLEDIE
ncbi:ATPase [Anaerocolumna sp. MB42-C2]|uniref:ATPase n=1 Tax=Anaerocolumna sp. MB42-C2 TaxID=3070997 RepID=UPI0027E11A17|nr:ATPase [Anaerocolumna sp. MB42-C2]WMJ87924.1 ATPase [Anaerocolumna sp. MB42-C2]